MALKLQQNNQKMSDNYIFALEFFSFDMFLCPKNIAGLIFYISYLNLENCTILFHFIRFILLIYYSPVCILGSKTLVSACFFAEVLDSCAVLDIGKVLHVVWLEVSLVGVSC